MRWQNGRTSPFSHPVHIPLPRGNQLKEASRLWSDFYVFLIVSNMIRVIEKWPIPISKTLLKIEEVRYIIEGDMCLPGLEKARKNKVSRLKR